MLPLVDIDLIAVSKVSAKGERYLLTMTDYFSKYVEAIPLQYKSAVSIVKVLYKGYCCHWAPTQIISDQGREFVNHICQCCIQKKELKDICVAAYITLLQRSCYISELQEKAIQHLITSNFHFILFWACFFYSSLHDVRKITVS